VLDPRAGERRPVRHDERFSTPAFHGLRPRDVTDTGGDNVGARKNSDDAVAAKRLLDRNATDASMRMDRPHENADKLAIELQVVGVTTVATQEASIVSARSGRDGAARSAHSSSLIGRGSSAVWRLQERKDGQ
jgi:hypothetical protein